MTNTEKREATMVLQMPSMSVSRAPVEFSANVEEIRVSKSGEGREGE